MTEPSERELFERALDCVPAERAAFLAANCRDENLRKRIERMLAADGAQPPLLATSFDEVYEHIGEGDERGPPPGSRIGEFTLLDKLGEGGA